MEYVSEDGYNAFVSAVRALLPGEVSEAAESDRIFDELSNQSFQPDVYRPMEDYATADTMRAVEALQPLCDILHIPLSATKKTLTVGRTKIGIDCKSTYATIMEAIGALFQQEYCQWFRNISLPPKVNAAITRYWIWEEK